MKIVDVTPFMVGPKPTSDGWSAGQIVVFVKLKTETGLVGWGEAYAIEHRTRAICELIRALGDALMEMAEATPRGFRHRVAGPMEDKHPSIDYACAVSAIEIALWDLFGKQTGLPLHALLGGALIDKVPLYANAWDEPVQSPEAVAERCARFCAEGYRSVKIYPLRRSRLEDAVACVRLSREAVGPEMDSGGGRK